MSINAGTPPAPAPRPASSSGGGSINVRTVVDQLLKDPDLSPQQKKTLVDICQEYMTKAIDKTALYQKLVQTVGKPKVKEVMNALKDGPAAAANSAHAAAHSGDEAKLRLLPHAMLSAARQNGATPANSAAGAGRKRPLAVLTDDEACDEDDEDDAFCPVTAGYTRALRRHRLPLTQSVPPRDRVYHVLKIPCGCVKGAIDGVNTCANKFRYKTYYKLADAFLRGVPFDLKEFVTLLVDIRWEEVPMAFGDAICNVIDDGIEVRPTLSAEFRCLVVLTVGNAFGSCRRDTACPWFHTNWDIFYARMTQRLILTHNVPEPNETGSWLERFRKQQEESFKKCFDVMMQLVEASMIYHTMGYLPYSTPIHAFLVANERSHATHMRNGFVEMGGKPKNPDEHHHKPLTAAHRLLLECVAQCILAENDRDVDTWERAFGFYAGSGSWRALAWRCRRRADRRPPHETHYNWKLEAAVCEAFKAPLFVSDADRAALAQLEEASATG